MQPNLVRKYKTLALICVFSCFAGVIFQLISERRLDFNSITVGLPLGLVFGLLELFLLPKAEILFRQWSFTKTLVFKSRVGGADITSFFAPAFICADALSLSAKKPVHSKTTSTS